MFLGCEEVSVLVSCHVMVLVLCAWEGKGRAWCERVKRYCSRTQIGAAVLSHCVYIAGAGGVGAVYTAQVLTCNRCQVVQVSWCLLAQCLDVCSSTAAVSG